MADAVLHDLHSLCDAAGVARHWRDVEGRDQTTCDDALAAILHALGHETGSSNQIAHSIAALADTARAWPAMIVTQVGITTALPGGAAQAAYAEIIGEDGVARQVTVANGMIEAPGVPGYHRLVIGGRAVTLAVAPARCPVPAADGRRMWGTAIQIPALRGAAPRAFGGFAELADAARTLAGRGCDAIAINPVHAMFPGSGQDFSPYSPSSRIFLNSAMGDPALVGLPPLPPGEAAGLIDWPIALPQRLAQLRESFAGLPDELRARIAGEAKGDDALRRHATFEALDCQFRPRGCNGWRDWPAEFRDPASAAVADFRAANSAEVDFHVFAQWLARKGLAAAQQQARDAGMATGLITDLAVGVHLAGSDTWALRDAMLNGLTIGAPPDPLGPLGQNWCITGFSPDGLARSGYGPWLDMVRAALRSAGGLRIDHAFGLARLWVIPEGETSSRGAYLTYPFLDLVRLLTLEAQRASALIVAEDLGTAPSGFTQAVTDRNMPGMRVLWFERAADGGFIGAHDYPEHGVAMTGTHDTPTLAGWWSGHDLDWAEALHRLPEGVDRAGAEAIRDWDRGLLWSTLAGDSERPAPGDTAPLVDAALAHFARTPAALVIVPLEDLLGEAEQPNLPGTTHEHPNWRRRLAVPIAELLDDAACARRLDVLTARR
ncbi:4-alpha-glucanotransferase [Sandarakinorhabdus sp.]|uniref:4-alpha-glucanotransferase n=1 Tax=Sandarakinorhabdus sp. TaxID=1916663 RepID=UPI00286E66D3|nr:4-alpha-glucanotransferase [Sandarakinorhabdus sp.]